MIKKSLIALAIGFVATQAHALKLTADDFSFSGHQAHEELIQSRNNQKMSNKTCYSRVNQTYVVNRTVMDYILYYNNNMSRDNLVEMLNSVAVQVNSATQKGLVQPEWDYVKSNLVTDIQTVQSSFPYLWRLNHQSGGQVSEYMSRQLRDTLLSNCGGSWKINSDGLVEAK